MKHLAIGLLIGLSLVYSKTTLAYEVSTHEDISKQAINASILTINDNVLQELGLKPFSENELFPNADRKLQTIIDLVRHGAEQEDNLRGSRFLQHFYDPYHHRALTAITANGILITAGLYGQPLLPTQTSPDWILEDVTDLGNSQAFSFKDARRYFFEALSGIGFFGNSATGRAQSFGRTFQTLGHVIHHIQDMAQPQHTKDEAHPTITNPLTGDVVYSPGGLYEHYTDEPDIRTALPFSGYEPVFSLASDGDHSTFSTPHKLWETGDGKGLAEFTNSNFITYGHNFIGSLVNLQANPDYPNPNGTGAQIVSEDVHIVPHVNIDNNTPAELTGKVYYIRTPMTDNYRGNQPTSNDRASTFSIYDVDLQQYHLTVPSCTGIPTPCQTEAVFSVNRATMRAAHEFLIPRAVGYSAGLINYFFRGVGKINLVPSPQDPNEYMLQNNGEEPLIGTFYLFYDDQNDTRWLQQTWPVNGGIPAHGQVAVAGFSPPNDPNHLPKTPGQYMLVFKGKMGQEGDEPSVSNSNPNFAIAANIVTIGNGGLIVTSGGDAREFAAPGAGGAVTIETGALLNTLPPATEALEVGEGETRTLSGPGLQHFSQISIRGTLNIIGDVTLRSDGPVLIFGTVDAQSATNPQDGAQLTIESTDIIFVVGRIDASGLDADRNGSGPQAGGIGGSVTLRTASTTTFTVPTIITRGGDAALTDPRYPEKDFAGAPGGAITITTFGARSSLALRFSGERLPDSAVDPLPQQQAVHELPTRTLFHRGLLTTGGYGGQFFSMEDVREAGGAGGNGGNITINCQQPAQVQFDETDLFTGGNIDVLLKYETPLVFSAGERARFVLLVQRTGAVGGRGSFGGLRVNGGDGGSGGAAGAVTMSMNCTLSPAPARFTDPPPIAPLFGSVDPREGISTKIPVAQALDAAGHRLYTLQAIGGGGGIPGGSAFTLGHCSITGDQCSVEEVGQSCPFIPGQTQLCLPDIAGHPGYYGPRGLDGAVSCGPLQIPATLAGPGLVCE